MGFLPTSSGPPPTGGGNPTVKFTQSQATLAISGSISVGVRLSQAHEGGTISFTIVESALPNGVTLVYPGATANTVDFEDGQIQQFIEIQGGATLASGSFTLSLQGGAGGFSVGSPSFVTVLTNDVSSGGSGGPLDGATDLGTEHRAPGTFFTYIIDVSDGSYPESGINRGITEFNARRALPSSHSNHIPLNGDFNVAILLPERDETVSPNIQAGPNYEPFERSDFSDDISGMECGIHFIGPWIGEANDTKTQAMLKVAQRDPSLNWRYGIRNADENGVSRVGAGGGHTISVDLETDNFDGSLHFWCMNLRAVGRSCINVGTAPEYINTDEINGELDIHFHLTQLHQDDITFGSNYPYWGVSSWHCRMHFHGYYSDLPWNQEHHMYFREEPYGDMVYEFLRLDRCGGQLLQKANRKESNSDGTAPIIGPGRTEAGTNYYRDCFFITRPGRWAGKASAWFTNFSTHQGMDFQRMVIAELDADNCRNNWPPPDPLADNINDQPYNFTLGSSAWIPMQADSGAAQGAETPYEGYQLGPLYMRDCIWYTKVGVKNFLDIRSHPTVDIEDCGFFTGEPGLPAYGTSGVVSGGSRSVVSIGGDGRNGLPAPNYFGSFRWINNCTEAQKTILQAAPFNIPSFEIFVPIFWVGENQAQLGPANQNMTFDSMTEDDYIAGVNPANLVITAP